MLLGPGGARGLGRETIPPSFPREFGHALEHVWRLRQRTIRLEVINEVMTLTATTLPLDRVYGKTAEAVARLIRFDALGVTLLDRERGDFRVLDVAAQHRAARGLRLPDADRRDPDRVGGEPAGAAARGRRHHRSVHPGGEPRAAVAARLPVGDPGPAALAGRGDRHPERHPPRAARLHGHRRGDPDGGGAPARLGGGARAPARGERAPGRGAGRAESHEPAHHRAARPALGAGDDQPLGHLAHGEHRLRHRAPEPRRPRP